MKGAADDRSGVNSSGAARHSRSRLPGPLYAQTPMQLHDSTAVPPAAVSCIPTTCPTSSWLRASCVGQEEPHRFQKRSASLSEPFH